MIELDDRRSHLGTSEQLCMTVQSAISEVILPKEPRVLSFKPLSVTA